MGAQDVALVLGGGGAAGQAWQIGIVAGLAEKDIDLTDIADLVIGTSAGATAAAWIRSGKSAADLLATILSPPTLPILPDQPRRSQPPAIPMDQIFERMRAIGAAATSALDLQRAMGAFGLECDARFEPSAGQHRRATVAARLPSHDWSERPMIAVAVEAQTGALATLDRDSGVDLVDAITASTALPGLTPTHRVGSVHYINGGVRSADNADLASGYANIVILSPLGGRSDEAAQAGRFEGLRRSRDWNTDLAGQIERLRAEGSRVTLITPDAASLAVMGSNAMDPTTRIPAAQTGAAQGRGKATSLAFS